MNFQAIPIHGRLLIKQTRVPRLLGIYPKIDRSFLRTFSSVNPTWDNLNDDKVHWTASSTPTSNGEELMKEIDQVNTLAKQASEIAKYMHDASSGSKAGTDSNNNNSSSSSSGGGGGGGGNKKQSYIRMAKTKGIKSIIETKETNEPTQEVDKAASDNFKRLSNKSSSGKSLVTSERPCLLPKTAKKTNHLQSYINNNAKDLESKSTMEYFLSLKFPVKVFCIAESFNIGKLLPYLRERFSLSPIISNNVYHVRVPQLENTYLYSIRHSVSKVSELRSESSHFYPDGEIIFFKNGIVVTWNLTESFIHSELLSGKLNQFKNESVLALNDNGFDNEMITDEMMAQIHIKFIPEDSQSNNNYTDESGESKNKEDLRHNKKIPFEVSSGNSNTFSYIKHDTIILGLNLSSIILQSGKSLKEIYNDNVTSALLMDKIAFSHGLNRSVKIESIEKNLETFLRQLETVPNLLIQGSYQRAFDQKTILKQLGILLYLRGQLNLNDELLSESSPELYWNVSSSDENFVKMSRYLSIPSRIHAINTKLDYANETTGLLRLMLTESHSHTLEKMIIGLICIEIGFECIHYYLWYFNLL